MTGVIESETESADDWLDAVRWNADGLVPVIAQDHASAQVLMMAWMNKEALRQSIELGQAVYYSRSRAKLWHKGESSGHFQQIKSLKMDCDEDVLLLSVVQTGGIACHTGREHCFYRELVNGQWQATEPVLRDPTEIYADS